MTIDLTHIADYLLAQSWQIAILVVAVAAMTFVLRDKSAHVRYLLWLTVIAKCLTPPLHTVPLAILPEEEASVPAAISTSTETSTLEPEVVHPTIAESSGLPSPQFDTPPLPIVKEDEPRIATRQWLGICWLVGASALLIFNLLRAVRANLWLWRRRKAFPAKLCSSIEELLSAHSIKHFPEVWLVEGFDQPFVWGLLRGSIYLPVNFLKIGRPEQQRSVLGHEFSHVLRFDAAVNILQVIAQAIFWFHPFVWWANRRIRAEREKCCDEMAIARLGTEARDYSSAIVEILAGEHRQNRPVPSLAVAGSAKNVEERIRTMMRPGKRFYKRPSLVAATVALLLALLTAPTAFVLTARAQAQAAPPYEEVPASEEFAESAEREIAERRQSQERVREEVEVRRSRRREEPARDELRRRREALRHRAGQIERELEGLQDDEDERARDLQAELRDVREQMRRLEREFADREPQRRRVVTREPSDVNSEGLMARRRRLQEQAHRLEDELAELERLGRLEEAERRRRALEEIHVGIRQIDERLGEAGHRRREPGPEARRDLMRERIELAGRARHIRRELEELGDREEARGLRDELPHIERRIHEIDTELRGQQHDPESRQEAQAEELRRDIDHLIRLGRHDAAGRLERDLHAIIRSREEYRDRRPEPRDGGLEHQVQQLRNEVTQLRQEMRELRDLLHQLLEREPRTRREREL